MRSACGEHERVVGEGLAVDVDLLAFRVDVIDCRLFDVQLDDAVLSYCAVAECDLRRASFVGASVEELYLSRCLLGGARLDCAESVGVRAIRNDFSPSGDGTLIMDGMPPTIGE